MLAATQRSLVARLTQMPPSLSVLLRVHLCSAALQLLPERDEVTFSTPWTLHGESQAEWGEWAVFSVVLLDVGCPSLSGKRRVYLQGRWLSLKLEISYIWKDHIINCTKENVSQVCCCCRELPIQKFRELGWTLWCGSGQVCGCKLVVFSTH